MTKNDETPAEGEEEKVEAPEEATPEAPSGQGEENNKGAEADTDSQYKDLDTLIAEKGWDAETANEQLLKSYQELEGKLGNWQEVEQKAGDYESLATELSQAKEKAEAWDRAQEHIKNLELQGQYEAGQVDLSTLPTGQLADLWKNGQIGIADLPKERQFEVERYVQADEAATNAAQEQEVKELVEKFPIIKDPHWASVAADQIEKGVVDPKTGRELTPEQIVGRLDSQIKLAEKRGEERIKKDTEELKKGNLERSDSGVTTVPNPTIKTVHDAFQAAKNELKERG